MYHIHLSLLHNSLIPRYVLYICDHHLSILYGRPSIVREDVTISGWQKLLKVPGFQECDKRLVSQMALLTIMSNVRELFGPDTGEPVPQAFAPQLVNYGRQIDQWMGYWSSELLSESYLSSHSLNADDGRTSSTHRKISYKRRRSSPPSCKAALTFTRFPRPQRRTSSAAFSGQRCSRGLGCHVYSRDAFIRLRHSRKSSWHTSLPALHDRIRMRISPQSSNTAQRTIHQQHDGLRPHEKSGTAI